MDPKPIKSSPNMSFTSGFMIMYGDLRTYLRHPLWFILTILATLSKFRRDIKKDFPQEWVTSACLPAWMYIRLKNRVGSHEAFEIVRAAFLPAILAIYGTSFRIVESPRTFENMVHFHEMSRKGLFTHSKEEVIHRRCIGTYAPNQVTFTRGGPANTLAEGAPHCTFIYENHSEKR